MDILKLLELAAQLKVPELVQAGIALVTDIREAADRAEHVLTEADRAELDAIHFAALAAADRLDQAAQAAAT